jgi:hypothetical protein
MAEVVRSVEKKLDTGHFSLTLAHQQVDDYRLSFPSSNMNRLAWNVVIRWQRDCLKAWCRWTFDYSHSVFDLWNASAIIAPSVLT